jgi:mannose-6-phosphate isomerase
MSINTSGFLTTAFVKRVEKPWGFEIIYTPPEAPVTGKILHVLAGKRLSLQYHDQKSESLCLIKGEARIVLSNSKGTIEELNMELNKGYYIQPGQKHRVIAISDIDFIEASTPEKGNTFRIEDDANRQDETEAIRAMDNRGWKK